MRRQLFWVATLVTVVVIGVGAPSFGASSYIPVQGRLTSSAGTPLNGAFSITFRLYDVQSGGTALCSNEQTVDVENGLFSAYFSGSACSIDGRTLYLGIEVGTDGEMTPRLYVDNSIYAWGLRPGAQIEAELGSNAIIDIENSAASGRGLRSYAMSPTGENYGVVGAAVSPDGFGGYFYNNNGGVGLRAWNSGDGGKDAIEGESESGDGVSGVATGSSGRGVYAQNSSTGVALAAVSNSSGTLYPTLYLVQSNTDGNFVVGASSYYGTRFWRVDRTGKGFFNGGTQASGADFAERIDVIGDRADYGPGDVLVISPAADRAVELAKGRFATSVIGVYSTEPAMLAGAPDTGLELEGVPVAITGIVPCKATTENGPIQRGDLLVTSSTPGHAMRAGDAPAPGTVLGKAMAPLESGRGVIEILVSLR